MKNILEILKSQNIELTDEQSKTIDAEVKANYKTINEFDRQKEKLDLANSQLKEKTDAFAEFKKNYEGVNVEELKGKVDELNQKLIEKDTDYQKKLGTIDLTNKLKDGLRDRGCIDLDLAMTQFNIDELLASNNQDADTKSALDSVVENKAMLFKQDPNRQGNIRLGGGTGQTEEQIREAQLREAMGLKGD